MKKIFFVSIVLLVCCISCISKRDIIGAKKNISPMRIAINDFVKHSSLINTDSAFFVWININNDSVLGISITRNAGSKWFLYDRKDSLGSTKRRYQTDYVIINNKLFYWFDSTKCLTKGLVDVMTRYGMLHHEDEDEVLIIGSKNKGTHYYFCKNNNSIFKTKPVGRYTPPKLNCKCKK